MYDVMKLTVAKLVHAFMVTEAKEQVVHNDTGVEVIGKIIVVNL